MRTFALVFTGLLISCWSFCQTPGPIVFNGQPVSEQGIDISRQTWFYEDPATDTLQTLASVRQQRFIPQMVAPKIHSHGDLIKSTRIVWLRFQLVNTHATDTIHVWYEPGVHALSTLYDSSGRLIDRSGFFARFSGNWPRSLSILVPPQSGSVYYVRLIDYIRVFPTDSDLIYTPESYALAKIREFSITKWLLVAMSMIVGCILLMGLYTLFQYYLNRDTTYLYYALYAGAAFCWIIKFADSRLRLGLAPVSMPQLFHPAWISISYSVSFFYALFLSTLLNLRKEQPILWRIVVLLMSGLALQQVMALLEAFTGPWFTYNTYYRLSDLSGLVVGVPLIVATVRSRSPLKTYLLTGSISLFIISISPLHGFLLFTTLSTEAQVFINYPPFFMALGVLIELFCFALALAYRNRLTELENQSMHVTYTRQLEDQLAQRTKEIHAQSHQLEEQRIRQLELGFEQKLAETEMTALRAQMNPHFIFNCLNSIKLYATENDAAKASDYLTKFSRLIRLVLENSRSERVTLQNELDALRLYLTMEAMRFKAKLSFRIDMDPAIDAEFIEIPPLLLQPYVENAIWHGLMHKESGGTVLVRVEQPQPDCLQVLISDDGIGRAEAAHLKSKSAMPKKSFGMKVTSERIALINQLYKTSTHVQIRDLVDSEGHTAGTEVRLEIRI
jgi:hypothetical protein